MSEVVSYTRRGDVAVITVDYPPVNVLNVRVRAGLIEQLGRASADDEVRASVLICAGRTFIAGADISEFGKPPMSPGLDEVFEALDGSSKPVVAAIHGTALGGGLETALACQFRVACAGAKLGLPEVNLGLIPGAGGTQRLPRLAGVETALEMIVSGVPVRAPRAAELGVVDQVVGDGPDELLEGALAFARALIAERRPLVRIAERPCHAPPGIFEAARARVRKEARGFDAPLAAIEAVEAAATSGFEAGMKRERQLFTDLMKGSQSRAQRYLFFAEREVQKLPDIPKGTSARPLTTAGVVGAGTMGGGIAMVLADAGMAVTLVEASQDALERGLSAIRSHYERRVTRGKLSRTAMDERLALVTPSLEFSALSEADLVIEAAFEDVAVKRAVFAKLDEHCKPGAILATNTSTLDVDVLAAETRQPERVLGLHFFSPAHVMTLLEIVRGTRTAADVVVTAQALSKRLKKVGVTVGVCFGFVANRMFFHYVREANLLLEEGVAPTRVDGALCDFGMPMGPLRTLDLAGLDVLHRIRKGKLPSADQRDSKIIDRLVAAGRLGQKSGAGYYLYEGSTPVIDEVAMKAFRGAAEAAGVTPRTDISDAEIVQRCLYPVLNEGFRILEEGIASRPEDIDVIWVHGFGFPRYRGGPMHYADTLGLSHLRDALRDMAQKYGDVMLPAGLLEQLAAAGKPLARWRRS